MKYERISITLPNDILKTARKFLKSNDFGYSELSPFIAKSLETYLNFLNTKPSLIAPNLILLPFIIKKNRFGLLKVYCEKNGMDYDQFLTEMIDLIPHKGRSVIDDLLVDRILNKIPEWSANLTDDDIEEMINKLEKKLKEKKSK